MIRSRIAGLTRGQANMVGGGMKQLDVDTGAKEDTLLRLFLGVRKADFWKCFDPFLQVVEE